MDVVTSEPNSTCHRVAELLGRNVPLPRLFARLFPSRFEPGTVFAAVMMTMNLGALFLEVLRSNRSRRWAPRPVLLDPYSHN